MGAVPGANADLTPVDNPPQEVKLDPALVPICSCESTGNRNGPPRQFNDDGSVILGKINQADVGMCQINLDYWGEEADKLGYDVFTEDGNIKMANHIYSEYGAQPWSWSNNCHKTIK